MRIQLQVILFVILVFGQSAQSKELKSMAVLAFSSNENEVSNAKAYTDRLRSVLVQGGEFRVMERDQMNLILREHGLQQSLCLSESCVKEMGSLLDVDYLLVGSFNTVGSIISATAKKIDIETGEILASYVLDFEGNETRFLTEGLQSFGRQIEGKKAQQISVKQQFRWEPWVAWSCVLVSVGSVVLANWQDNEASQFLKDYKEQIDHNIEPSDSKIKSAQKMRNLFYVFGGVSLAGATLFFWEPWNSNVDVSLNGAGVQWHYSF